MSNEAVCRTAPATPGLLNIAVGQLGAVGIRPYYQAAGRTLSKKTLDRPAGPLIGIYPNNFRYRGSFPRPTLSLAGGKSHS